MLQAVLSLIKSLYGTSRDIGMSLKKSAVRGSLWTSVTQVGINLLDFFVFAYLARVLTLEEFGLASFCYLFIELSNSFVEAGVNQNIAQRSKWENRYAASTTMFVFLIALGVCLLLIFIIAPVAYYLYSALAAWILISLTPITLLASLQIVLSGKLLREFKIKEMGAAKFFAALISVAVIVLLAENNFGLWSLIIGKIVNAICRFLFFILATGYWPRFNYNKRDNNELVRFCLPLLGITLLNFVHQKASVILTGFVLGPATFALLTAARKGEIMINQITMSSINAMVVPSFARVEDKSKLGDIYIKMVATTAFIVFPIFMGLAAVAEPFVHIAFGDKFSKSAEYITILAFATFQSVVAWFFPSLLVSVAKTKSAFNQTIITIVSTLIVASCTVWFGVKPMLIGLVIIGYLILPFRLMLVSKHVKIDFKKLIRKLTPPFVAAIAMFLFVLYLETYLESVVENELLIISMLVLSGFFIYLLILLIGFRREFSNQIQEVKDIFKTKS